MTGEAQPPQVTGEARPSQVMLKPWVIALANSTAVGFGAVIVWIALSIGTSVQLNLLVCVLGGLIGWGIGVLASPFNKTEEARFITLGQAISAFVSGYLISKVDRYLEVALFTKDGIQDAAWERTGLFVASCLVMVIVNFMNRMYWLSARTSTQEKS